jgi:hypothetical protein
VLKARVAIGSLVVDHAAEVALVEMGDLAEIVAGQKLDLAGRS